MNNSTNTLAAVQCINGIVRFAHAVKGVCDEVINGEVPLHESIYQLRYITATGKPTIGSSFPQASRKHFHPPSSPNPPRADWIAELYSR